MDFEDSFDLAHTLIFCEQMVCLNQRTTNGDNWWTVESYHQTDGSCVATGEVWDWKKSTLWNYNRFDCYEKAMSFYLKYISDHVTASREADGI